MLVDPSSPFSGGSVLGDRIRVNAHYNDSNVYIRSLASRNSKGGLSENISEISDILESAGYNIIIYETVGIGQVEIDVVEEVDTVVLTLVPESGDDIQMMKAGILEIADIFVINKFDRKDSDRLYISLKNMISIAENNKWTPPIVKTIAVKNKGIQKLYSEVKKHKIFVNENFNEAKHKIRYKNKVNKLLLKYLAKKIWSKKNQNLFDEECDKDISKQLNPYQLFEEIISNE